MKIIHIIAFLLTIIGGLNWGLIGLFNFNLVTYLLGTVPTVEKVVYILVGLSALYLLIFHKKECKICK